MSSLYVTKGEGSNSIHKNRKILADIYRWISKLNEKVARLNIYTIHSKPQNGIKICGE